MPERLDYIEHIFPLLLTQNNRVIYESDRNKLIVNSDFSNLSHQLTKIDGKILALLLGSPDKLIPYKHFMAAFYPENSQEYSPIYMKETINPPLCRLRKKLDNIMEELGKIIVTRPGPGLVYVPHQSIVDW